MIAPANSSSLISLAEAVRITGLSASSIRLLCDDGTITSTRTSGGHRRLLVASVREWCGYDVGKTESVSERRVACYVRVSSTSQNIKTHGLVADGESSLDRQRQRVMRHAAETEGIDESELLVFQDVASSFADTRQGLNRLLDAIIAGQVSRLYVLQQDRLARLGCVLGIVNHFAEQHGVEIVYLDDETDKDEAVSDWQDLMVIIANTIQHANAKMAGLKSAKVVTKRMDQVTVDAAKKLRAEGLGLDEIADKLNADGHVLTRQDGTTHKITRHALRKWAFATPKGKLHLATPKDCGFANWWNEHMEACSGNRIEASRVYDSFRRYRKNRGHKVAGTNSRLGHEVPNVQRERRLDRWWFVGWKIKGENVDAAKLDVVDSFAAFVERFIVKSDGGTLETRQVWSAYTEFCRANNLKMESRKHAGLYLRTIASSATLTSSKTFSFGGLRFVG